MLLFECFDLCDSFNFKKSINYAKIIILIINIKLLIQKQHLPYRNF